MTAETVTITLNERLALSPRELAGILRKRTERRVVARVASLNGDSNPTVEVSEHALAEYLVKSCTDCAGSQCSLTVTEVRRELRQTILPRLDDAGLVAYQRHEDTVRPTEHTQTGSRIAQAINAVCTDSTAKEDR